MTLVPVSDLYYPRIPSTISTTLTSSVIDAAGEKVAWIGRVWNKDRASKSITKIGFLTGAITPNSSTMRISLQDVEVSAQPMRPDGVQDQTVDFADTAPTANSWYHTEALSASRSVTHGELLAVVLEFQVFGAATVFNVRNAPAANTGYANTGAVTLFTASWAKVVVLPDIILEFSDGTFGTLRGEAFPFSAFTSTNFASTSNPDEIALRFQVPFRCRVDGMWVSCSAATARDFEIGLYRGTTAMVTQAVDADAVGTSAQAYNIFTFAEQTLEPNTTYYASFKPTTGNLISYFYIDVADANHFQAHSGGTECHWAQRVDAGAWTPTTTRRPLFGISISALEAGDPQPTYVLGI